MREVLFITWDGEAQDYLASLFLPIFARLRSIGVRVHVLQFSFASAERVAQTQAVAASLGVPFAHRALPARRRTLALPAILPWGAAELARYARQHKIDGLMPRSLMPATMTLIARRLGLRLPVVFDADGFMADERVDFAGWSQAGTPYRTLKWVERTMHAQSQSVIVRTAGAKAKLINELRGGGAQSGPPVHVIPNLADAERFAPASANERLARRSAWGVHADAFVAISVGSLGPHYVPQRQARLFRLLSERLPSAHWVILTGHRDAAEAALVAEGVDAARVHITRVPPDEVARHVAAADVGFALRQASPSQIGVCPIKIGEYLLCGTPTVATAGVGDVETYLAGDGFIMPDTADEAIEVAADEIAAAFTSGRLTARREAIAARARGIFSLARVEELYAPLFA